jgi:hypothetical protein
MIFYHLCRSSITSTIIIYYQSSSCASIIIDHHQSSIVMNHHQLLIIVIGHRSPLIHQLSMVSNHHCQSSILLGPKIFFIVFFLLSSVNLFFSPCFLFWEFYCILLACEPPSYLSLFFRPLRLNLVR